MTTKPNRDLCIMACIFCKDPEFHRWIDSLADLGGEPSDAAPATEADAKEFIITLCQVKSRNDLDRDPAAAERFHELVRKPYLFWKNPEQGEDTFYSGMDVGGAS